MSKLIIIRGLPGSGKTTKGKELLKAYDWPYHVETDQYFVRPDGAYDFNSRMLKQAHEWCQHEVFDAVCGCIDVAIVSNTFTQWWEMEPYIKFCKENGHGVEVITLTDQYENIHGVPEETMKKMAARFESHDEIMKKVNDLMSIQANEVMG